MVRVFLFLGKRKSNSRHFTVGEWHRNSKKWEVFQILSLGILIPSLAISFSSDGIFISSDVFFIISRDFFTKVRSFPLKERKYRKKQADFRRKHQEVAKFKSSENRLFPTNSFGVANGVLNQGVKMTKVFLVLKVYNSFSFQLSVCIHRTFQENEHLTIKPNISGHHTFLSTKYANLSIYQSIIRSDSSNISSFRTRDKAEPKCRFSLMYV